MSHYPSHVEKQSKLKYAYEGFVSNKRNKFYARLGVSPLLAVVLGRKEQRFAPLRAP
jgi:hypothetical protein